MIKIILTTISILAIVITLPMNTVSADQRHTVFEMGESGQTVSFPMTSEEIAAIDARPTRLVQSGALKLQKTAPRLKTIEMGESGQIVSFLMTPEEIQTESAEKKSFGKAVIFKEADHSPRVVHELAESGLLIEFAADKIEVYSENLARVVSP